MHFDLSELIVTIGYIGIFAIIFAESGLLIGFFLPGDTLLFTAGFLASQGLLSLPILLVICFVGATLGYWVGYIFGDRVGRRLFQREDSWFFHRKNLIAAQEYYEKHGVQTLILARFIPIIRTFVPIVAGIAGMDYKTFLRFNIISGLLWAVGLPTAGYFLGKAIPDVDKYLLPIVGVILVVSVAPGILHLLKKKN
jgi:membrane-associated protein